MPRVAGGGKPGKRLSTKQLVAHAHYQNECSPSSSKAPEARTHQQAQQQPQQQHSRRALLGLATAALALPRTPAARAEPQPYLLSTGGKGIFAEEEARLVQLRKELEASSLLALSPSSQHTR